MSQQYTLRDGTDTSDRRLDRIPLFDPRSLNFRIMAALSLEQQQALVSKTWPVPEAAGVLDQGQQGACAGAGVTNELLFFPVAVPGLDMKFAREKIYWPAQREDPWPGGDYPSASPQYEGTAVLYAVKAAADLGYYTEYRWAKSEKELALGVGYLGPAIIGIDWYEHMFRPDSKGFIHPTGDKAGGHCCLLYGIDIKGGFYKLRNSWGPSWGDHGSCKLDRTAMAKLLAANGEACIITGRAQPPPPKLQAAEVADALLAS